MNSKVKTPAKADPVTATQATAADAGAATVEQAQAGAASASTDTSAGTATSASASAGATESPAPPAEAEPFKAAFGPDFTANADAAQELVARDFPLAVRVTNEMPRRVTFPELQGLLLAHVAGLPELKTQPATFRSADQLHRFVTDVQALCELNGFKAGVIVETV